MLPRTHLIRIQRNLYEKLRGHTHHLIGGLSPQLKHYFREYQRDFQTFEELSTKRELLIDLLKSDVIFLGDYHTLAQAQRTVIRILRDSIRVLKRKNKKVVLALEMLNPEHDALTQKYLTSHTSEKEYLKQIRFQENWGFAWEHYRPIFEFAREHQIRIVGVNSGAKPKRQDLKSRDQFAAKVIASIARDSSNILFVLFGDLHLSQNHLPKEVSTQFKKLRIKRALLTIHQNDERLYWQLVEQGLEQFVDVVKVRHRIYCVMNTPPWIKLQSHVKWVELAAESKGQISLKATELAFDDLDYAHEVQELTTVIAHFFELPLPKFDDFEIYGPLDKDLLDQLTPNPFNKRKIEILKEYVTKFKSQFIPKENILFLNSLSLNHIASLSSLYLHSYLTGSQFIFENPARDFYSGIWNEALGFLGAKVINPKRKCLGLLDLRRGLAGDRSRSVKSSKMEYSSARLALEHLEVEFGTGDLSFLLPQSDKQNLIFYKTAKILGHLLGHSIYHAMVDNRIPQSEVRALYFKNFEFGSAKALYFQWIKNLDRFDYRKGPIRERF